jgi:hypothetical protein
VVELRELQYRKTGKKKRALYPGKIKVHGKRSYVSNVYAQVRTPLKVTDEQLKGLKKRGFKPCMHALASSIEAGAAPRPPGKGEHPTHMTFSVTCNEADEVEFLVRLGVPFTAAGHYGHDTIIWDGGDSPVWRIRNPGLEREMYWDCSSPPNKEHYTFKEIVKNQSVRSVLKDGWEK